MSNYKVRVNNEAESKEVQGLFFELGVEWRGNGGKSPIVSSLDYPFYVVSGFDGLFLSDGSCTIYDLKKLTIPQLRDMVVLKRNSIEDATHIDSGNSERYGYLGSDGVKYFWNYRLMGWKKLKSTTLKEFGLKPIKKPIKEYLVKENGVYVLHQGGIMPSGAIVVPEGADTAGFSKLNNEIIFFKDENYQFDKKWIQCGIEDESGVTHHNLKSFLDWGFGNKVIWQRHTQPEELPFVDDEPKQSLNNTYAEIEQVRHSHYFKDVSELKEIDVYQVLRLFNVIDPCLQHIVKKALCAGQRGHKDLQRDLQDILDTAKRAVEINK